MTRRKEQAEAGLCVKGLHPFVDGQRKCLECRRDYLAKWREANREAVRESSRAYASRNRERITQANREWREANREASNAWAREYRKKHPEYKKAAKARRRSRERTSFKVAQSDLERLYSSPCAHAHLGDCDGPMHVDHVVPLSRGGRHSVGNLQPLCRFHNQSKKDRLEVEVKARARREVAA